MSDYGYVAERAKNAFSAASRSAKALERNPQSVSAQLNYASRKKLAEQAQVDLLSLAEKNRIEVCSYRMIPADGESFPLLDVSKSCLSYQNLFSQVHDAVRNGRKSNALIGREAYLESALQVAYTFDGSLGFMLLVKSERGFFESSLDESISAFFDAIQVRDRSDVSRLAEKLGQAVVKRVRDWSRINADGNFSIDLTWKRSDGIVLGGVYEREDFTHIVKIISEVSDEQRYPIKVMGTLVGIDLKSGTFHMSVDQSDDIRGSLNDNFSREHTIEVGPKYTAYMTEITRAHYATDTISTRYELNRVEVFISEESSLR